MACMHYLGSGKQWHVDADRVIKGRTAGVAGIGGVPYQQYCVVVAVGAAVFGSKIKDVCGVGSLMGGDMIE